MGEAFLRVIVLFLLRVGLWSVVICQQNPDTDKHAPILFQARETPSFPVRTSPPCDPVSGEAPRFLSGQLTVVFICVTSRRARPQY